MGPYVTFILGVLSLFAGALLTALFLPQFIQVVLGIVGPALFVGGALLTYVSLEDLLS